MKCISHSLLLVLLLYPLVGVSSELNKCTANSELNWIPKVWPHDNLKTCECDTDLIKYEFKTPSDMKLIAVCDYRAGENGNDHGNFYFIGNLDITGEIDRQEHVSGTTINFNAYRKFRGDRFMDGVGSMKFTNEQNAIKLFNAPKISDGQLCWKAAATIRIKRLLILEGETDEAGGWPYEYEAMNVGVYDKCIPQP